MKTQLAFALLVILISSVSLSSTHQKSVVEEPGQDWNDQDYPELNENWVLEFDHASRNGVPQESNKFAVEFNGKRLKEWIPTDYNIHHQKLELRSIVGKNSLDFVDTGISDGLGQGIDNVQLVRFSFCGREDVIINGGFEQGHNLGNGWSHFANGKIPGWLATDNVIEIGHGRIYNNRWPADTHILELDGSKNSRIYQVFNLDEWFRIDDYP